MGTLSTNSVTVTVPRELEWVVKEIVAQHASRLHGSVEIYFQNGHPNPTLEVRATKRQPAGKPAASETDSAEK